MMACFSPPLASPSLLPLFQVFALPTPSRLARIPSRARSRASRSGPARVQIFKVLDRSGFPHRMGKGREGKARRGKKTLHPSFTRGREPPAAEDPRQVGEPCPCPCAGRVFMVVVGVCGVSGRVLVRVRVSERPPKLVPPALGRARATRLRLREGRRAVPSGVAPGWSVHRASQHDAAKSRKNPGVAHQSFCAIHPSSGRVRPYIHLQYLVAN